MKWHSAFEEWPTIKSDGYSDLVLLQYEDLRDKQTEYDVGYWVGEEGNPKGDNEWQEKDGCPFEYHNRRVIQWHYCNEIPYGNEDEIPLCDFCDKQRATHFETYGMGMANYCCLCYEAYMWKKVNKDNK